MGNKICKTVGELIYDRNGESSNLKFLCYVKHATDTKNTYVDVECTLCGKHATKGLADIRYGKTKSCGCLRSALKTTDAAYRHKYKHYRRGAKRRELTFSISFEEFIKLGKQNCYYCGLEPEERVDSYGGRISKKTGIRNISYTAPFKFGSIDRINSSKGYVKGNCRPSCIQCNTMKLDYTESDFLDKIKAIYKNLIYEKKNKI